MEEVCTKWKEACELVWYDIKKYKCESSIGRSYDNRLLTQSYLEKILLRCGKYLKELSLSDVCDFSIMPFVGDHCKNLTSLELSSIDDELLSSPCVLDKLSTLQCLEHLYLCYVVNLKDSTITAIANNCKNLKSLDVRGCTGLTETALVAFTNLENLEKLDNLKSLDIGKCRAITKTGLDALTKLENLQRLDVSYLNTITDSFLIKLKGLKTLNCNVSKEFTDAGIIQFIKNNPDLEKICVRGIDNITTDMVIAADQATKNRTNGIVLHIICGPLLIEYSKSLITSQWLVVE
ncbi:SCF E3 ubiquitin ligase complex F-box protein grrA-like [Aphidius gifuensis]|uniref:SCF E3 ubiquitin ligase complex F-box protein grrA-like n=1 Tax=Aphidius gifuensis TaxID=684658 RepID=UPI001CDC05BE|nr:SCF E3 ubiquitin ligase complex F-box protein grrA-like [Aphidius gifuensis]